MKRGAAYDTFTISPKPPFDLAFGARFFASRSVQPQNSLTNEEGAGGSARSLVFYAELNNSGVEITVSQAKPGAGNLSVGWRCLPWVKDYSVAKTDITRADVRTLIRRVFSLDLDIKPFYKIANANSQLAEPFSRAIGFKPVLAPNVFDSALWAIVGQQVTFTFARTLKHRLHQRYGRTLLTNSGPVPLTPTPEKMARAGIGALRKLQLSESKAKYIKIFSRAVVSGELDLDGLAQKPYDEAVSELVSIKGIGVWSANYILMRGAGHLDALPLGDAGLKRAVKKLCNLSKSPAPEIIEEHAEPFRPYRSLYTLYLWQTLD